MTANPPISVDSVLKDFASSGSRHTSNPPPTHQPYEPAAPDPIAMPEPQEVNHGCYTELPVPQLMLDVQFQDKTQLALPYHDLQSITLNPSGTLTLAFTPATLIIKGSHLQHIYKRLQGHYVTSLRPSSQLTKKQTEPDPRIESIQQTQASA